MEARERSILMSKIRSVNTQPEKALRSALFKRGYRFRIHKSGLPGRPDIVLAKYSTAIFVHGCIWHQHKNCKYCFVPKTRLEYWLPKLKANDERDKRNVAALISKGWRVLVVWECEIKDNIQTVVTSIEQNLSCQH